MPAEAIIPSVIHIVENNPQLRAATSYLLARQGYRTEIYASAEELLAQPRLRDGCILFDWNRPGPGALEVLAEIEARFSSIPMIMIGDDTPVAQAIEALRRGAVDFLQRPYDERDLIAAIERAIDRSRESVALRQRKAGAQARIGNLSSRKRQVLQGLLAGMSNKVIAQRLALSPRTVELYRAVMMEDLDVGNLAEALRMAIDAGLTPLNETIVATAEEETLPVQSSEEAPTCEFTSKVASALPTAIEILEGTTDCVFLVDHEWRFTYLNAHARKLIAEDQDFVGLGLWDKFPLAAATRAWDELHRTAADRQPTRFEFYEPDLRIWFDVSVRPFSKGLQVSFRDIGRERISSAQLQLSEEALLQALEAAGDGAWDWNIRTGELAMSRGFLERLGYDPETFPPHFDSFIHLVHPGDVPRVTGCLKNHLDGSVESFRCEYRLRRADGGWLWNFDRGRVVARDPVTALPLRMVGTSSDISHIKAAQQDAEEALQRLELAQANAGVGIWDLDLETGVVRFCERSRAMHGLGPEGSLNLTQQEWSATVCPADREQVVSKLQVYIASGETYRIRYRTVGADGKVRWVMGMGKAVRDSDGEPRRFVGLNLEVTALAALIGQGDDDDVAAGTGHDDLPRGDEPIDEQGLTPACQR